MKLTITTDPPRRVMSIAGFQPWPRELQSRIDLNPDLDPYFDEAANAVFLALPFDRLRADAQRLATRAGGVLSQPQPVPVSAHFGRDGLTVSIAARFRAAEGA